MTRSVEVGSLVSRVRIDGSLGNRLGTVLLITLLPVPLVSLVYAVHSTATGTPAAAYSLVSGYSTFGAGRVPRGLTPRVKAVSSDECSTFTVDSRHSI
jgi:hypothetical protein